MLVLDTDDLPERDRAEAFQAIVSANSSTSLATFEDARRLRATMHVHDLGPGRVFNVEATGNTLRRDARMARAVDQCTIALAVPTRGRNRMAWEQGERLLGPGDLLLVDLASPYAYGWSGDGSSYAFQVDADQLALPLDLVRRAATRLEESPLYGLVRDHVLRVTTEAEHVADEAAANHLGLATVELMRALVLSVGGSERHRRDAFRASVLPRIQRYVSEHLRDPDLSPREIAAAVGISLRTLYALHSTLDTSLEQSILRQRLEGARRDLASPTLRERTITEVAASWGFANHSHFSRRFRVAFGLSPREWRATTSGA